LDDLTYSKSSRRLLEGDQERNTGHPLMDDPDEHALVLKAFALACGTSGYITGYVEWCHDRAAALAREKLADLDGFTPEAIRDMSIAHVRDGGAVSQHRITAVERDYRFYYKVILPCDAFPRGIFVKFRLVDDDPVNPAVHIVNAHRQGV
jgi:hypothetical protein